MARLEKTTHCREWTEEDYKAREGWTISIGGLIRIPEAGEKPKPAAATAKDGQSERK